MWSKNMAWKKIDVTLAAFFIFCVMKLIYFFYCIITLKDVWVV